MKNQTLAQWLKERDKLTWQEWEELKRTRLAKYKLKYNKDRYNKLYKKD